MSEEQDASGGGGGGSKMLLIIGLVGGLAIGGGGAFVILGGGAPAGPEDGATEEKKEPEVQAPDLLFSVVFERVAVPIYGMKNGRQRFEGNYFIDIEMQTTKEGDQLRLRQSEARIKHAIIEAVSRQGLMQKENPLLIDTAKARVEFLKRAEAIVGKEVIYDLSITNVQRVSG